MHCSIEKRREMANEKDYQNTISRNLLFETFLIKCYKNHTHKNDSRSLSYIKKNREKYPPRWYISFSQKGGSFWISRTQWCRKNNDDEKYTRSRQNRWREYNYTRRKDRRSKNPKKNWIYARKYLPLQTPYRRWVSRLEWFILLIEQRKTRAKKKWTFLKNGTLTSPQKKTRYLLKMNASANRTRAGNTPWSWAHISRWTNEWTWSNMTKDGKGSPARAQMSWKNSVF